jgi:SpoVK/Ycf46/Vps4 family AAA+-type ATPase
VLSVACPLLLSSFFGGTERNVRAVFEAARGAGTHAVMVLEEFEAIAGVA